MQLQQQAVPLSSLLRPALSLAQETWIHSTEQHEYTYIAMGTGNILEASEIRTYSGHTAVVPMVPTFRQLHCTQLAVLVAGGGCPPN